MRQKIKWLAWFGAIGLLLYTRLVNLAWGLPFPFHPDERNMAVALQQLRCDSILDLRTCLNPHFFAYGQLQIYLGYLVMWLSRVTSQLHGAFGFDEAVVALRYVSVLASIGTVYGMWLIIQLFLSRKAVPAGRGGVVLQIMMFLMLVCSPVLIQLAHFGTTESVLMALYTWLVLLCLRLEDRRAEDDLLLVGIGFVVGAAIAVKVSSISFLILPFICIASVAKRQKNESRYELLWQIFNEWILITFVAGATSLILSPHNLFSWPEFVSSMQYESAVALGAVKVFYTWTFEYTVPMIFQITSIFPYALGLPVFLLFVLGFFTLPNTWRANVLRLSVVIFFILWSFAYTKWTRFMAPLFPIMIIIAALRLHDLSRLVYDRHQHRPTQIAFILVIGAILLYPGLRYIQVYRQEDSRMRASRWMVNHIPSGSMIIQETANVVDLPLLPHNLNSISFNFYELDQVAYRAAELRQALSKTQFIIIPSRRLYMNYWCDRRDLRGKNRQRRARCIELRKRFPRLNQYYDDLFSGKLGFRKVAEFGTLDDERAEETWSVFDHPIIRIYKKF